MIEPEKATDRLPRRPRQRILGEYGERFVEITLPKEWIVRRVSYDYGLDLNVELARDYRVTGQVFSIQVGGARLRILLSVSHQANGFARLSTLEIGSQAVADAFDGLSQRTGPQVLIPASRGR